MPLPNSEGLTIKNIELFAAKDGADKTVENTKREISDTLDAAKHIPERYRYPGSIDYTLTFGNPHTRDAVLYVEFYIPKGKEGKRFGIRLKKIQNEKLFAAFLEIFNLIASRSKADH